MATKIPEAINRTIKNMFICQKCQTKQRADPQKVLKGKVRCRNCKKAQFRVPKKK